MLGWASWTTFAMNAKFACNIVSDNYQGEDRNGMAAHVGTAAACRHLCVVVLNSVPCDILSSRTSVDTARLRSLTA